MSTTSDGLSLLIRPGFTFYDNTTDDNHLRIVASDPSATLVLVVNMTTVKRWSDTSCVFNAGEHVRVFHPTCIAWSYARLTTTESIIASIACGDYRSDTPLSPELIRRVWDGAEKTKELSKRARIILQGQSLIFTI